MNTTAEDTNSPSSAPDIAALQKSREDSSTAQVPAPRVQSVPVRPEQLLHELLPGARVTTAGATVHTEVDPSIRFAEELASVVRDGASLDSVLNTAAAALQACGATFVARYRPAGERIGETDQLEGLTAPSQGLDASMQELMSRCCQNSLQTRCTAALDGPDGFRVIACSLESEQPQVLAILSEAKSAAAKRLPLLLELTVAQLSRTTLTQRVADTERGALHAAALVEVLTHLDEAGSMSAGAGRLTRELQRYLGATRVVIGHSTEGVASCRLIADTGQETVNPLSEETRLIQAMLEESVGRRAASLWPPQDDDNRHALLAHAQLAVKLDCRTLIACPITTESGTTLGAVCVLFRGDDGHDSELPDNAAMAARHVQTFLAAASAPMAAGLSLLDRSEPGLKKHLMRSLQRLWNSERRRTAGLLAAALLAALLLPVTYRITAEAELQPISRRFVAAPFDSTLQECLVRPGEYVDAGTVLARLDEREIKWELAGVQADMSRARKERNTHLADHEYGEAAIARHEVERLHQQEELLHYRSEHLELRSPIEGIVVSGDHKDEEGVPLKTGETLFEVAPLDEMIIEVALPEEDIRWVKPGMPLALQLDALPAKIVHAEVARIHPRSELRDHENVFIVEARLPNDDGLLRPGMRGHAKISSDRHLLAWNLFHKPAAHLLGWLGW